MKFAIVFLIGDTELHDKLYNKTLARCIAIAAPDCIECVPTSEDLKPSLSSPIVATAAHSASLICLL